MNDFESIWTRIMAHSNQIILRTKRGLELKYEIRNNMIYWIPLEDTMNTLFPQSRDEIRKCVQFRSRNLNPSQYSGTACSYKWALLNHPSIWVI